MDLMNIKLHKNLAGVDGRTIMAAAMGADVDVLPSMHWEEFSFSCVNHYVVGPSGPGTYLDKIRLTIGGTRHFRSVTLQGPPGAASFNAAQLRTKMADLKNQHDERLTAKRRDRDIGNIKRLQAADELLVLYYEMKGLGVTDFMMERLVSLRRGLLWPHQNFDTVAALHRNLSAQYPDEAAKL